MGAWSLAVEGQQVRLGLRTLGRESTRQNLGTRALGEAVPRLGMGVRTLALRPWKIFPYLAITIFFVAANSPAWMV